MNAKPIPRQTFKRLPGYYNILVKLREQGVENVSSTTIAGILGLNDVVVRKDLAAVGENGGRPRTGYIVSELTKCVGSALGYYNSRDAVLAGAGQLGRALLSYRGFDNYGVKIIAAFDSNPELSEINGKPVFPVSELEYFCKQRKIRIGIITVPEEAAQSVCDSLIAGGVRAVWNFAPIHLEVPEEIFVRNENMALSLSLISRHLTEKDRSLT